MISEELRVKKYKFRKFEGITLISLVISIVILIILAGIGINLSIKEDGIFNRAKEAKNLYVNAQSKEEQELNEIDGEIDYNIGNKDVFEKILELCEIEKKYQIEDLSTNKDGILTKILQNKEAIDIIVNSPSVFLETLTNSETAIAEIVENVNIKKAIAGNLVWARKIIEKGSNITGFDEKCQTIPKMTSSTEPEGKIIDSGTDYRYKSYYAFDKNNETVWLSEINKTEPSIKPYIIYKYNEKHSIYKIDVDTRNPTNGSTNNILEIYISEEENGEDSWIKIYDETYSFDGYLAGTPHNVTCKLDKVTNVRRIKVCSSLYCGEIPEWYSQFIEEIRSYGI